MKKLGQQGNQEPVFLRLRQFSLSKTKHGGGQTRGHHTTAKIADASSQQEMEIAMLDFIEHPLFMRHGRIRVRAADFDMFRGLLGRVPRGATPAPPS